MRDPEKSERTSGRLVAGLAPGTSVARAYEATHIFLYGGPPKLLLDHRLCRAWVTGQSGLQHMGPFWLRDKELALWRLGWARCLMERILEP